MAQKSGKRRWRWILLGGFVAFLLYLAFFGLIINIDTFRGQIETALSRASGFTVRVEGPIDTLISLRPGIRIYELSVRHPDAAKRTELAHAEVAAIQIDLISLLRKKILINKVRAEDVVLAFRTDLDGSSNWTLDDRTETTVDEPTESEYQFVGVNDLELTNVHLIFLDDRSGSRLTTTVDSMLATAGKGELVDLSLAGSFDGYPVKLAMDADSLDDLMRTRQLARSEFSGSFAGIDFSGTVSADWSGDRPHIDATLDVPELVIPEPEAVGAAVDDEKLTKTRLQELAEINVSAELTKAFDGRLDLSIGRISGLPLGLHSVHVVVEDSGQTIVAQPIEIGIGGGTVSGDAAVDFSDEAAMVSLRLEAGQILLEELLGSEYATDIVRGSVSDIDLSAVASGITVGDLVKSIEIETRIGATDLHFGDPSKRSVPLSLDQATLTVADGQAIELTAAGAFMKEDFALRIRTGGPAALLSEERWPVDLDLTHESARVDVDGHAVLFRTNNELDLDVSMVAGRLGDLSGWFGWHPSSEVPFELRGHFAAGHRIATLENIRLRVADNVATGALTWDRTSAKPHYEVKLRSDRIDAESLAHLGGRSASGDSDDSRFGLDLPILPVELEFPNADIDIQVGHFAGLTNFSDVEFVGKFRDGSMQRSSFAFTFVDTRFTGLVVADFTGNIGEFGFEVSGHDVDFGRILHEYGIAENVTMSAGRVYAGMRTRGTSLRQILDEAQFRSELDVATLHIIAEEVHKEFDIEIKEAVLQGSSEQPTNIVVNGSVQGRPVDISIDTAKLLDLLGGASKIPISVHLESLDDVLDVSFTTSLPLRDAEFELDIAMSGNRLDALPKLVGPKNSRLGPYEIRGQLRLDDTGYYLTDLVATIGESNFGGDVSVIEKPARSLIKARLVAHSLQYNDFSTPDHLRADPPDSIDSPQKVERGTRFFHGQFGQALQTLFDFDLDMELQIEVSNFSAGDNVIGGGRMSGSLADKRLEIESVHLDLAGGTADFSASIGLKDTSVDALINVNVDSFDYGVPARRIKPDSRVSGLLSLNVEISSEADRFENLLKTGNGHIDVGIWPGDIEAGVFDVWSVNLILAVVPLIRKDQKSKFNCTVGRFILEDGILRERMWLLDTSRLMVYVRGEVNLKTDEISLLFLPRQKRSAMFSWQTPARVGGTLDNMRVRLSPVDLVRGTVGLAMSPITSTSRNMFGKNVPPDGSELCRELFSADLDALEQDSN